MTSTKNRERILEAIDQLRRRKARPDVQRICNYLFRRFAVNSVEARSDLDWCVANNHVLKVEYKGSISYRNAAKKYAQMKQRDPRAKQIAPKQNQQTQGGVGSDKIIKQFSELLTNAFGELIVDEPDYLEFGVPGPEIVSNILAKDSVRYTKKYISILLEKEVQSGGLIRTDNGNYLMGPADRDEDDVIKKEKEKADDWKSAKAEMEIIRGNEMKRDRDSKYQDNGNDEYFDPRNTKGVKSKKMENFENMDSSTNSADEKKCDSTLRIGGRRKRAKKVFDPSDNHIPKKRGRPLGSLNRSTIEKQTMSKSGDDSSRPDSRTSSYGRDQGGVCSVCHLQNKRGPNDRMVACRECSNKAHFSCLNGEDMMLKMYPDNTWQCPHCKTCIVCFETSDAGTLTVCSVCADAYHARCHQPKIAEKFRNGKKWLCINCQMPEQLKINEIESNIGNSFTQKFKFTEDSERSLSNSPTSGPSYMLSSSPPPSSSSSSSPPPCLSPQTTGSGARGVEGGVRSIGGGTRGDVGVTRGVGGGERGVGGGARGIGGGTKAKAERDSPAELEDGSSDSQSDEEEEDEEEDEGVEIDPSIPDATHWTAEEVYQYFARYFPEEAKIFKEQEIDGRSLLLLKRLDVLTNLNLKLGPALKIYRHVVKLQVRRDDPRLYWL